ncbi:MAG: TrbC/VirB2 family protein, partial [Proteobacteria bacterium]|nr:TrbC/VirB2 family protein [Pseudomonadota bacterium]
YIKKIDLYIKFYAIVCACFLFIAPGLIQEVLAADSANADKITEVLCNASNAMTGAVGKSIAIILVISLAIGLLLGKVTWGLALALFVGLGILFGAKEAVKLLSGDAGDFCV